jgi:AraC family transcriptional regulator
MLAAMGRTLRLFEGRFGRLVLVEPGDEESPHSHPDPAVLLLHKGPETEYALNGQRLRLGREDVIFLNAGQVHVNVRPAGAARPCILGFYASGDWLRQSVPAVFGAAGGDPFPRPHEPVTPRIRRLADALAIEVLNDRFLSSTRLEFMLQELVLSIVDTYLAKRRAASLWRGSRFEDSRIRQALALLRARPNKELNIDQLASQVGLSRSRFYDLFQLCTGLSPRAYLDLLCVETAISRLAQGQTRIADLSAELGFSAQSNFTRFFLHQVGIPPSEYRRATSAGGLEQLPDSAERPQSE